MSELGQLLKKARMEKNISLDDLQESTKIRKRYLEAIEEGNYKILPGNFYVRAFIKSYSEEVGLNPDDILRMYHNFIPPAVPEQPVEKPMRKSRKRNTNSQRFSKIASALLVICFPILIVGIIYYYATQTAQPNKDIVNTPKITDKQTEQPPVDHDDSNEDDDTVSTDTDEPSPDTPLPDPVLDEPTVTHVSTVKITDFYEVKNAEQLTIELQVTGDSCWFLISKLDEHGEKIEETTLKKGESRIWVEQDSVWLRVGRANSVEVKVNGVLLNSGDQPNPKNFQIDLVQS